jgi:hypothetical protein
MKIGEDIQFDEHGRLVHIKAYDPNVGLEVAEKMRHAKDAKGGKLLNFVGKEFGEPQYSYPMWLEEVWSQRWGVRLDDPAFEEVIQIELNSGEYEKFRI